MLAGVDASREIGRGLCSVVSLELADAVLFLDAEPLAAALVGTGVVQFDHFTLVVS